PTLNDVCNWNPTVRIPAAPMSTGTSAAARPGPSAGAPLAAATPSPAADASGAGVASASGADRANARSTQIRPLVTASSVRLERTNGRRGSTLRSVAPRYGAMALATDKPTNESAASQGTLDVAAYLPRSTQGGARRADDVADQIKMSTNSTI